MTWLSTTTPHSPISQKKNFVFEIVSYKGLLLTDEFSLHGISNTYNILFPLSLVPEFPLIASFFSFFHQSLSSGCFLCSFHHAIGPQHPQFWLKHRDRRKPVNTLPKTSHHAKIKFPLHFICWLPLAHMRKQSKKWEGKEMDAGRNQFLTISLNSHLCSTNRQYELKHILARSVTFLECLIKKCYMFTLCLLHQMCNLKTSSSYFSLHVGRKDICFHLWRCSQCHGTSTGSSGTKFPVEKTKGEHQEKCGNFGFRIQRICFLFCFLGAGGRAWPIWILKSFQNHVGFWEFWIFRTTSNGKPIWGSRATVFNKNGTESI